MHGGLPTCGPSTTYRRFTISNKEISFHSPFVQGTLCLVPGNVPVIPLSSSKSSGRRWSCVAYLRWMGSVHGRTVTNDYYIVFRNKTNLTSGIFTFPPFWVIFWLFNDFHRFPFFKIELFFCDRAEWVQCLNDVEYFGALAVTHGSAFP